jgi:hypothetical protein
MTLGLAVSLVLTAYLEPWFQSWNSQRSQEDSVMEVLMGESRRMFATHFYVQADVYFHSGNYPTIFDENLAASERHMENTLRETGPPGPAGHAHAGPEEDVPPSTTSISAPLVKSSTDWIARFGEYFKPSKHVHLEGGANVREILPWLQLSVELDPHRIETYTVAAFWLRTQLGKVAEAEAFLRQGWKANPDSYEILFELGRLFEENRKDTLRAGNVWELALRKWREKASPNSTDDQFLGTEILGHLAQLEYRAEHWAKALAYFTELKQISSDPKAVQAWIEEINGKLKNTVPQP